MGGRKARGRGIMPPFPPLQDQGSDGIFARSRLLLCRTKRAPGTRGRVTSPVMGSVAGDPSPQPQGRTSCCCLGDPLVGFLALAVRLRGTVGLGLGGTLVSSSSTRGSLASSGRWTVCADPRAGCRWRRGTAVGGGPAATGGPGPRARERGGPDTCPRSFEPGLRSMWYLGLRGRLGDVAGVKVP